MGRPPSNGAPAFRFSPNEVSEMETILQEHKIQMPSREVIVALAEKFSSSEERSGKITVQMKQVWNWFQNRRYALRAKGTKPTGKFSLSPLPRNESTAMRNVPQAPQFVTAPPVVQSGGKHVSDNAPMEFEAKSARDGAWYDVASFLSHRSLETGDPDVLVRFAGFGPEEDEWVNVRKYVRPRSLPCEASECVAVLPGDLILCFQEGKDQALYFDAHVLDSQRRRHDVRGCRCRFLVRYDHDQSEEIVPLRKVCRRPETDYRLQQLHTMNESGATNQQKTGAEPHHMGNTLRVYPPSDMQKLQNTEETISRGNLSVAVEDKAPQMRNSEVQKSQNAEPISHGNIPVAMEVEAPQTKIPEVQKPQNTGEPISHGHTPITMEDKAPQTRNPEVQKLQKAEPFSHGVTPVAMEVEDLQTKNPEVQKTQNTEEPISHCDSPIAREVKAPQTRNPEVQKLHTAEETFSHGDTPVAMKVKDPQTKNPNVQKLQNPEPISHGDTPVATEVKAPQMENPEASAGVAVRTSMVPPSNEAVTSGATNKQQCR